MMKPYVIPFNVIHNIFTELRELKVSEENLSELTTIFSQYPILTNDLKQRINAWFVDIIYLQDPWDELDKKSLTMSLLRQLFIKHLVGLSPC